MSDKNNLQINPIGAPIQYTSKFEEDETAKKVIGYAEMQRTGLYANDKEAYAAHVKTVDENIKTLISTAATDTLGSELLARTQARINATSWLASRTIPAEETVHSLQQTARETFGLKSVGKAQKIKRGRRFAKKARMQASMMNQMRDYYGNRDVALEQVLEHGRNFAVGKDVSIPTGEEAEKGKQRISYAGALVSFFHQTNSDKKLTANEKAGEIAKDVAMYYYRASLDAETEDDSVYNLHKGAIDLSDLYKEETKKGFYKRVLTRLGSLDLSKFDYKSNEEFATGKGENSFACRFAELRYFSHSLDMLEELDKNGWTDSLENAEEIRIKAQLIREILADYENRAILLQSPYFVLLASRDFDKIDKDELIRRKTATNDPLVIEYLDGLLKQKEQTGYGRGKNASKILAERLKKGKTQTTAKTATPKFEETKTEATKTAEKTVEEDKASVEEVNAALVKVDEAVREKASPCQITDSVACRTLPFIADPDIGVEECDKIKNRILWFHRDLNAKAVASWPMESPKMEKEHGFDKLYQEVDWRLYVDILDVQQTLENFRAKVAVLMDIAQKTIVPAEKKAAGKRMREILGSPEYKAAIGDLLDKTEKMRAELEKWQSGEKGEEMEALLRTKYSPGYFNVPSFSREAEKARRYKKVTPQK